MYSRRVATNQATYTHHLHSLRTACEKILMANYRDINALAKEPSRVRNTASFLLTLTDAEWSDWEIDFLEGMSKHDYELSTRQAEKLVELHDDAVRYTSASGFRFTTIIAACWRNRFDLESDEDIEFIERLKNNGEGELRRRDAMRLRQCAVELGEVEPNQYWSMTSPKF
jgi:hypothetical protein